MNRTIDHTLLKPDASFKEIDRLIDEALAHQFAAVCINPMWVELAAKKLRGSVVAVCTVVGFPLGANRTEVKVFEAKRAVADGAGELDMVINLGLLKGKDWEGVQRDIHAVVEGAPEALIKVILETGYLTQEEITKACQVVVMAGAHFVKTSTGFGPRGASVEDVQLMRETVGKSVGVKAAGGIRDVKMAEALIAAGANRIGTSHAIKFFC